MFCHLCATKIEEEDFFCRKCGEASVPILLTLDKRNWLSTVGFFLLGCVLYGLVLFAFLQIVAALIPDLRNASFLFAALIITGVLVSGFCAAFAKEASVAKRKLKTEREKRRAALSKPAESRLLEARLSEVPVSVTENTTVKLKRQDQYPPT